MNNTSMKDFSIEQKNYEIRILDTTNIKKRAYTNFSRFFALSSYILSLEIFCVDKTVAI